MLVELREDYFSEREYMHEKLNWNSTQIDFLELVNFLVKTKIITKNDDVVGLIEAVKVLSEPFNLKIKDVHSKLSKARQRKEGYGIKLYQKWTTYQQSKNYLTDQ